MIDAQGLYDPRDADDNMMLKFMALMSEGERMRLDDRFEGLNGR